MSAAQAVLKKKHVQIHARRSLCGLRRLRHATTVEIPLAPGDPLVLFVGRRLATFHVMNMHEVHGIITKVGIQYVVRSGLFSELLFVEPSGC